jgi:DNA (cytosine-5)-methyltransferase 1
MLVPAGGTWNDAACSVDDPMRTRTARDAEAVVTPPVIVNTNHDDDRTYPADGAPLASRTAKIGDGVATPPSVMSNRTDNIARGVDGPVASVTTGNSHALVTPFLVDRRDYNGSDSGRVRSTDEPMGTVTAAGRTVRTLCVPAPFVTMLRNNQTAAGVHEPLSTLSAGGRHHALTVPPGAFLQKHHGGLDYGPIEHMTKDVAGEPMPSLVARPNVSLVIPYRRASKPTTTDTPLPTIATREQAALVEPAIDVNDCHFRMLKPREHLLAQRFPFEYIVKGNKGEQTMQAGNAVSANVAHWIARQVAKALDSRSAA